MELRTAAEMDGLTADWLVTPWVSLWAQLMAQLKAPQWVQLMAQVKEWVQLMEPPKALRMALLWANLVKP